MAPMAPIEEKALPPQYIPDAQPHPLILIPVSIPNPHSISNLYHHDHHFSPPHIQLISIKKQFNLDLTIIVSIWRKHYEVVQFIVSSQPFIASTVYPQILSKYSIHGDFKTQKSISRRFL